VDDLVVLLYLLGMKRFLATGLWSLLIGMPILAFAHSAGDLDLHGCHADKRYGTYHCHRGPYQGIEFRSKSDLLQAVQSGSSAADAKREAEAKLPPRTSLFGPLLSERTTDQRAAGSSEVVMPQGIEKRLETLQALRDKGLITDAEYETKRKEILGQL
jgi:hypothetical protein